MYLAVGGGGRPARYVFREHLQKRDVNRASRLPHAKRQSTGAVQKLAPDPTCPMFAKRLGRRQCSGALGRRRSAERKTPTPPAVKPSLTTKWFVQSVVHSLPTLFVDMNLPSPPGRAAPRRGALRSAVCNPQHEQYQQTG